MGRESWRGRERKKDGRIEGRLVKRGTAAKAVEWKGTGLQNFPGLPLQVTDISHSS